STTRWRRIEEHANVRESQGTVARISKHTPTGELPGFAFVGPARDDDAPTPRQLWAINVLATHQGTGVADLLLAETLGDRNGFLWVVEANARAQSFYRRHGFEPDGGRLRDEELAVDEIRMVRRQAPGTEADTAAATAINDASSG
ncbi:MAG: GNAT family N-acetyltransferase, partial [Nakamurella sp.]